MNSDFSAALLRRFARGDIGLSGLQHALAETMHADPGSAPELIQLVREALEQGLLSAEASRLLSEQVERARHQPVHTLTRGAGATTPRTVDPGESQDSTSDGTLVRGIPPIEQEDARRGSHVEAAQQSGEPVRDATLHRHPASELPAVEAESFESASQDSMPDETEAVVVRGRYRLESLMGSGGMGQVWRAKDLLLEQARDPRPYVAIKLLNSDFAAHPNSFVALQREAAKAQDLAHPNVATVYNFDLDRPTGKAFICMELLEGQPLDAVIRDHPTGLDPGKAMNIIRQLAKGLAHAHSKGIVHCDFKPGNAFLTDDGEAKILDFGIARIAKHAAKSDEAFDAGNLSAYTPSYATVEMSRGEDPHASDDVYALGLVAFELLTGRHPYGRLSANEVLAARLAPPPLKGLRRRESRAIRRAIVLEREDRWPDARAFQRSLERLHPLVVPLIALAGGMALVAGYAGYQYHLESLPQVPFMQLPERLQIEFRAAMYLGDEAYQFAIEASDPIEGLEVMLVDALSQYASAYSLHPKNPDAHAALRKSLAMVTRRSEGASRENRQEIVQLLQKLRQDYPVLAEYPPLQRAIRVLQ